MMYICIDANSCSCLGGDHTPSISLSVCFAVILQACLALNP